MDQAVIAIKPDHFYLVNQIRFLFNQSLISVNFTLDCQAFALYVGVQVNRR